MNRIMSAEAECRNALIIPRGSRSGQSGMSTILIEKKRKERPSPHGVVIFHIESTGMFVLPSKSKMETCTSEEEGIILTPHHLMYPKEKGS